jgi:lipopolysaccharide transport system permease protein
MPIETSPSAGEWTTIIKPAGGLWSLPFRELVGYRDLLWLFVKRDLITQYKQTVLGPFWFVLQPLLTTAVFFIVFGRIANIPTDGIPRIPFYMSGVIVWNLFSLTLVHASESLTANIHILSKIYFPRLIIPLAQAISSLARFGVQFLLFVLILIFYDFKGATLSLGWTVALLPLLILYVALLGFSVGLIISALTTRYRDLAVGLSFGMQLWMYATPIVYPLTLVPRNLRPLYLLNPVVPALESFKNIFFGSSVPRLESFAAAGMIATCLLLFGLFLFGRIERSFVDTV